MEKELFVNGELILSRKETYGKKSVPVFTSRMEKRDYYKSINYFDIRNVIDMKAYLKDICANWNKYVSQVYQWIQKNPAKKLIVTGIFTVVFGVFSSTANAAFIQEYIYQVKNGENIENIAKAHGVTAQEIVNANGISSIDGKKILLPKVEDRTVTATMLNIRSHPNTKSSIIGTYKKGDVVKVSYIENGWAGILIEGRLCFVSANYLTQKAVISTTTPTIKTADAQVKTMYVTASSLRVRQAASTSSEVIGSLKLNARVDVLSISNVWAQINFNGKAAFVSNSYLTNDGPAKKQETVINSSVYKIKSGDTFTKISKTLGTSVSDIQKLNPTVNPLKLKIGQTIKIPVTTAATATANQMKAEAQIGGVDPTGTFRFITSDGNTYNAKATGNLINQLFKLQGKKATLTLEGNRGQQLVLTSLQ